MVPCFLETPFPRAFISSCRACALSCDDPQLVLDPSPKDPRTDCFRHCGQVDTAFLFTIMVLISSLQRTMFCRVLFFLQGSFVLFFVSASSQLLVSCEVPDPNSPFYLSGRNYYENEIPSEPVLRRNEVCSSPDSELQGRVSLFRKGPPSPFFPLPLLGEASTVFFFDHDV